MTNWFYGNEGYPNSAYFAKMRESDENSRNQISAGRFHNNVSYFWSKMA